MSKASRAYSIFAEIPTDHRILGAKVDYSILRSINHFIWLLTLQSVLRTAFFRRCFCFADDREADKNRNGKGNKPWIDGSSTAMRDFWLANGTWLPTWGKDEDRGMTVKSVKMWQQGEC